MGRRNERKRERAAKKRKQWEDRQTARRFEKMREKVDAVDAKQVTAPSRQPVLKQQRH